jgi:hypothetical protein
MGINKRNLRGGRRRAIIPAAGAVIVITSQGLPRYSLRRMPAHSPSRGRIILYLSVNPRKMPLVCMVICPGIIRLPIRDLSINYMMKRGLFTNKILI